MGVALRCGDGGVPEHPLISRRSAPFWDILLVLVTLSMIMLPQLGNFNWLARYVVVKEDVAALCAPLKKFLDGVMLPGPFVAPGGTVQAPSTPIGLLASAGLLIGDKYEITTYTVFLYCMVSMYNV